MRKASRNGVKKKRQEKPSRKVVKKTLNGSETAMRFMVIVKANKDSEAGALPDKKILEAMGKFNDELVKAGVMLAGEGLQASSKGVGGKFSGKQRVVRDRPLAETKELIARLLLLQGGAEGEADALTERAAV